MQEPIKADLLRDKIIGLGDASMRKSYYPELQRKLSDLQRFKALINSSNDVLIIVTFPELIIVDVNEQTTRLFSLKKEDIFNKSINELSKIDFFKCLLDNISMMSKRLLAREHIVFYYTTKEESALSLEISLKMDKFINDDYLIIVCRNISQRVKALNALKESEQKYKTLVEQMPMIFFEVNFTGKIVFVNKYGFEKLGYTTDDVKKMTFLDVIIPEEHEMAVNNFKKRLSGQTFAPTQYTIIKKDGSLMPAIIESLPIVEDNKVVGLRGFIMDITDRIQLEQEQQRVSKIESMSILAGGIAHDFNNILTAIIGNINLATMNLEENSNALKFLNKAEIAAYKAKDLTEKLLLFSKEREPIRKIVSVSKLINDIVDFCFHGTQSECIIDMPEDLFKIYADDVQIGQVFQNLIINAEQAMPKGGTLTISAKNIELSNKNPLNLNAGKYVEIVFTDEGIGIPEANLQKIFDPYFTTKDTGSGLGLATAYGIIKKHHGLITVRSQVNVGTSFIIYLPASVNGNIQ
ncbi:MAG: PAS domain S-box protein [Thermodesulfovibrionales bacterium]|nr:PAS domain S-box protein [Thermodesulfovibrionales bacterium]